MCEWNDDFRRAQPCADRCASLGWVAALDRMYDKVGLVLRVQTVITQPEELRVRRRVHRRGRRQTEQSTSRYLHALAQVDDPTPGLRGLDALTTRTPSIDS